MLVEEPLDLSYMTPEQREALRRLLEARLYGSGAPAEIAPEAPAPRVGYQYSPPRYR